MTAGPGPQPSTTAPPQAPARRELRGDIEGLRAIAVLLVLLYHLGVSALSGGFAGVDVFFVISGFLITSHLLSEVEKTGRVRIARFYARRARRLLPAAALVLIFTVVVGFLVLPVVEHRNLSIDAALATVYVVNWGFANRAVDYLAEDAAPSALQHYWSLSVEEQFYVIVPLLLLAIGWLATRYGLRSRVVACVGLSTLLVASLAYSIWLTTTDPATAYFVTPTRIWELAVGSVLACLLPQLQKLPQWSATALALLGMALLGWTAFVTNTSTPWPGSAALFPVLGTAFVIMAGCGPHSTVVARLLSLRPMVWIGGLSYAIYLWHWPLVVFADNLGITGWQMMVGVAVLTILLSMISRRLVENPIRFGTLWSASTARGLAVGALGMAASLTAAAVLWTTLPTTASRTADLGGADAVQQTQTAYPVSGTVVPEPALAEDDVPVVYDQGCQLTEAVVEPNLDCVYGHPDSDHVVAIVGDSKMAQWTSPLIAIAEAEGWRLEVYTKSRCGLNTGFEGDAGYPQCWRWGQQVLDHLTDEPGRVSAVITSMGRSADADSDDPVDEKFAAGHVEVWESLQDAGVGVVALLDNPYPSTRDLPSQASSVYGCVAEHRDDWSQCQTSVREDSGGAAAMAEALQRMPEVASIDLGELICPQGECPPVIGNVLVWRQGSHITDTYALTLQEVLWQHLIDLGMAQGPAAPAVFDDEQ